MGTERSVGSSNPRETKAFTVVSLFSGAMGLDLGLEKTGRFRLLACLEKEPVFCRTIRKNRDAGRLDRDLVLFEGDISDIDPLDVLKSAGLKPGQLDLLVGGPPCQAFSTAGRRRTTDDPRGTLLWQYLRFVDAMRPRFFLMENVRGLLSAALKHRPIARRPEQGGVRLRRDEEPGSVVSQFAEAVSSLDGASYHMDCFEVNAVNYGAPQLRERAIFIGNRYGAIVDFPDPTHVHPAEVAEEQPPLFPQQKLRPWRTLRDAIGRLKERNPVVLDFSPRKKGFLGLVPPGSNWRSLPEELQKESMGKAWYAKGGRSGWWRRLSFDLPCPTLVTMPNHASTALCHPEEIRALTLRECASIQGFPHAWEFCGTTSEQYTQVGNAVPIRLGEVAGELIARELERLRARNWQPFSARPIPFRAVYIKAHVRTRQWFHRGKTLVRGLGQLARESDYRPMKTLRRTRAL